MDLLLVALYCIQSISYRGLLTLFFVFFYRFLLQTYVSTIEMTSVFLTVFRANVVSKTPDVDCIENVTLYHM